MTSSGLTLLMKQSDVMATVGDLAVDTLMGYWPGPDGVVEMEQ